MATNTLKDIAAAVGMSESSASRILNGKPGYKYSEETRQRVLEAAARMGYQANAAARLLKQQKKTLVGLAVHLTESPYLNRLLLAARDQLVCHNYEPVLVEPMHLVAAQNRAPFPSLEMLAGLLSLDLSIGQPGSSHYENLRRVLPVVALYPIESKEIDWVYTDGALGVEMAVDHLVELGHRRIAFVESPESSHHGDHLKIRGWQRAVKKHRLSAREGQVIAVRSNSNIEERAAQIEEVCLDAKSRPTALMCSGDESALAVMGRLQRRNWRIPEDLSIVGYDGIAFGAYAHPSLTTVVQPVEQIAQAGVKRLLEVIEQGQAEIVPRQQLIEPRLLVRDSTAQL